MGQPPTMHAATTRPYVPMPQSLKIKLGPYRGPSGSMAPVHGPSHIEKQDDGRLVLVAQYNPPGSCLLAIIATVVSAVVVGFFGTQGVPFVLPGLLIWYVIFKLLLRRGITFDLAETTRIICDDRNKRIAVVVDVEGREGWIGISAGRRYLDLVEAIRRLHAGSGAGTVESAPTQRGDTKMALVMLTVIVAILTLVLVYSLTL